MRYKHIVKFLLLFGGLITSYYLKISHSELEPFPAVIMPSGHYTINVHDTLATFTTRQLVAYDSEGKEKILKTSQLLSLIPNYYFTYIKRNHFGLNPDYKISERTISERLRITIGSSSFITVEERKETVQWLKNRLRKLECNDSLFIVQTLRNTYNTKTKYLKKTTIKSEEVYKLY